MNYRVKGFIAAAALSVSFHSQAVDERLEKAHLALRASLDLTPEQIKKIEQIKTRTEQRLEVIGDSDICASAIPDALASGTWDEKVITKALDEKGKTQSRMQYYRVRYLFDASQVLTSAQREKFILMLKQHPFD